MSNEPPPCARGRAGTGAVSGAGGWERSPAPCGLRVADCPAAAAVVGAGRWPEGDVCFGRKAEAMAAVEAEAEWEPAGLLPAAGGGLDWGERGGGGGRGRELGAGPALRPLSLPQRLC